LAQHVGHVVGHVLRAAAAVQRARPVLRVVVAVPQYVGHVLRAAAAVQRVGHVLRAAAAVQRAGPVLRSVLITVLGLAHVHAARTPGLAPQPPQRELEAKRETRLVYSVRAASVYMQWQCACTSTATRAGPTY
jgi:hypothetical protein